MSEKYFISWEEFHSHTKQLAKILQKKGDFDRIVSVSRGGLLPAGILAYEMNIRSCDTINISGYDEDFRRDDSEMEYSIALSNINERTIFVDDLADTGRTIKIIKKQYPQAHIACVYAKPKGQKCPDTFFLALPEKWVVFPWD